MDEAKVLELAQDAGLCVSENSAIFGESGEPTAAQIIAFARLVAEAEREAQRGGC